MINPCRSMLAVPYTFVLMNYAVVAGLFYFLRGYAGYWNEPTSKTGLDGRGITKLETVSSAL
jgi:hypothetical protein